MGRGEYHPVVETKMICGKRFDVMYSEEDPPRPLDASVPDPRP